MKRLTSLFSTLLVAGFIATSCAPATATPIQGQPDLLPRIEMTEGPAEKLVSIGFTTSLTGNLSQEARKQSNGFLLWMDDVNKRGGLLLDNNIIVKFEPKFYDDQSDSNQAISLYEKLVLEDNVTFLFSPYSSTLADVVAPIANQNQKIMISAGAASDSIFKKGYSGIYQIYTPASKYLNDSLDLLAKKDPTAKRIAIIYENDRFSTGVVESLKNYAESRGFEIVAFESYNSDTTDFVPLIKKLIDIAPDAIFGGGHAADGQALAKQVYENSLTVQFMALLVAPADSSFINIGQGAIGVVGASQWEPTVQFEVNFGPSVVSFNQAYQAAYSEEPTYHAAGGYAAGLVLEKALLEAGSLDQQKIKAALDNTNIVTFFGPIRFERSEASHGLQIGRKMIYIQWQRSPDGTFIKQIVWPEEGKSADLIYPMRSNSP